MNVYMEITKDEYELPLAIADSVKELGSIIGVKPGLISDSIYQVKTQKIKKKSARFIRVDIGDEE